MRGKKESRGRKESAGSHLLSFLCRNGPGIRSRGRNVDGYEPQRTNRRSSQRPETGTQSYSRQEEQRYCYELSMKSVTTLSHGRRIPGARVSAVGIKRNYFSGLAVWTIARLRRFPYGDSRFHVRTSSYFCRHISIQFISSSPG